MLLGLCGSAVGQYILVVLGYPQESESTAKAGPPDVTQASNLIYSRVLQRHKNIDIQDKTSN